MRPIKPDGATWSPVDSNRMLQHFHEQVRAELHERDVARGLPKSGACGRYVRNTFVVDPRLSALKHSGAESIARRRELWTEFCSTPKDPATELGKLGLTPSPDETPTSRLVGLDGALGQAVQAAIQRGIEAGLAAALSNGHNSDAVGLGAEVADAPKPRKAGRPRKVAEPQPVGESSSD